MKLIKLAQPEKRESVTLSYMKKNSDMNVISLMHKDETAINALMKFIVKEMSSCGLTCVIVCGGRIEFTEAFDHVIIISVSNKHELLNALESCQCNHCIRSVMVYIERTERFAHMVNSVYRQTENADLCFMKDYFFLSYNLDNRYIYKNPSKFVTDYKMSNLKVSNGSSGFSLLIDKKDDVDETSVLMSLGLSFELITKKGNWYSIGEIAELGRVNFLDALDCNDSVVDDLRDKLLQKINFY